jgi:hypothetical protein
MSNITGFSMVKSYRRCPKQYEYKYIQNLQRLAPPPPLIRGTILHEILDARAIPGATNGFKSVMAKYEEKYGTLFKEEKEMYGESFLEDIERVYKGYLRTYDDTDLEYLSSEEFVTTPLVGDIIFQGHIDKRIFKDGRMWVMDHKTHKNIPTEEQRFNDYQLLMYVWAYNREHSKGDQVEGVIWDYIRTKPPTIPDLLVKGGLSQAKNIDTDVFTYTKELVRHRLDQKPYKQFLAELAKRSRDKFYQRVYLPAASRVMTEQVVQDFTQSSQIMHGLRVYPRSASRECSWCEYYRICNAELRGLDHKFIRESEYKVEEVSSDTAEED